MPVTSTPIQSAIPIMQTIPTSVPSIFGMMAPSLTPTVPSIALQTQPTIQPTTNQPLPFAPSL